MDCPRVAFHCSGGFWVVDAQPRQWLLRKPPWAPGRDALKAEVRAAEMGLLDGRMGWRFGMHVFHLWGGSNRGPGE